MGSVENHGYITTACAKQRMKEITVNTLRVFIVDDNQDFAESLALLIEGRGYDVELAFSGEEAIEKFHQQDFDITFMDVKLPGMDGVESFVEIRKFERSARVVMMTGYSVEQLLEQAVEQGAVHEHAACGVGAVAGENSQPVGKNQN